MTTTASASAALERDLALLERFGAAHEIASQTIAVAIGITIAIGLIALTRLALGWRPRTHRASLAVVGAVLATWTIAVPLADRLHDDAAPESVEKAELCQRLFDRLAAHEPASQAVDRALAACPDHTGALRGVLTAGGR